MVVGTAISSGIALVATNNCRECGGSSIRNAGCADPTVARGPRLKPLQRYFSCFYDNITYTVTLEDLVIKRPKKADRNETMTSEV